MSAAESKLRLRQQRLKAVALVVGVVVGLALVMLFDPDRLFSRVRRMVSSPQAEEHALTATLTPRDDTLEPEALALPARLGPTAPAKSMVATSAVPSQDPRSDEIKTLASLKKVDEYPLYTMT